MRILITGVSGMLGSELWNVLAKTDHELVGTDVIKPDFIDDNQWRELDIADQQKTYQVVSRVNPELIIHTAAYTDVDGCEKNPDLAYRVNALGTRNLLLGAQRFDTAFLYISTDMVFGDGKKKSYSEMDLPSPVMEYARSKYLGEQYVEHLSNKFYIVRISWLFGKNKKNYVLSMIDSIQNGKAYTAAEDMIASPTYAPDLSDAVAQLIDRGAYGVYHITNNGYASRYDVAMEVARILKNENAPSIKKIKLDELKLPAQRSNCTILENYMWRLNGYTPLRNWKEAVKEFIGTLNT